MLIDVDEYKKSRLRSCGLQDLLAGCLRKLAEMIRLFMISRKKRCSGRRPASTATVHYTG